MDNWMRVRFHANYSDSRPVKCPPPGPWWESGFALDESYAVVVAYVRNIDQVVEFWPEAGEVDIMQENVPITFTDRFQKPDWWTEETPLV